MSSARGQPIGDVANARFAEPKRAREHRLIGLASCGRSGHLPFDSVKAFGESAVAQMYSALVFWIIESISEHMPIILSMGGGLPVS